MLERFRMHETAQTPTSGRTPMSGSFQSTREVILRTDKWSEAVSFYGSVLGLPMAYQNATMVGFETGAFRLYVEKGKPHPPVFELLAPDVEAAKRQLLAAGCTIVEEDPALPRCYIRDPYGFTFNLAPTSGPK
jgi:predicted enzyme related to lactoylglutathione lyase